MHAGRDNKANDRGRKMSRLRTMVLAACTLMAVASTQSTPAAARSATYWDGLFVSLSAGGSWTSAESSGAANFTISEIDRLLGIIQDFDLIQETFTDKVSGDDIGAVFTFTMGYNFLFGSWLLGIQSEVSYNRTLIEASGSDTFSFTETEVLCCAVEEVGSGTSQVQGTIERIWTISEMARIGFLVAPDWLVYGLVGWSWSGFEFRADFDTRPVDDLELSYTLDGFTWGAGAVKNFGWLRVFIQYKGIDFAGKTIDLPTALSFVRQDVLSGVVFEDETTGSSTRQLSAISHEITAGLTIPINFNLP